MLPGDPQALAELDSATGSQKELIEFVRVHVDDPGFRPLSLPEVTHVAVFAMLEGLARALCVDPSEHSDVLVGGISCTSIWNVPSVN
jgi:hypothetical protein